MLDLYNLEVLYKKWIVKKEVSGKWEPLFVYNALMKNKNFVNP